MTTRITLHALKVFDQYDEPCWLIRNYKNRHTRKSLHKVLKLSSFFYACEYIREIDCICVNKGFRTDVQMLTGLAFGTSKVCFCSSCTGSNSDQKLLDSDCLVFFVFMEEIHRRGFRWNLSDPKWDENRYGSGSEYDAGYNPFAPPAEDYGRAASALGLTWPCSYESMVVAFRNLAFTNHPDRGGSNQKMVELISARDSLMKVLKGRS